MGQKRHALHGPHGYVKRPSDIHGHRGGDGHWVGNIHVSCCRDVDRRQVDGDRVLQADRRRDVDCAGGNVHRSSYGDRIAGVATAVHSGGDGCRVGDWRCSGRVVVYVVGI